MARDRTRQTREEGELPAASPVAGTSAKYAHIKRIEAAMSKIARALPLNSSLSSVWNRLEDMHQQAMAEREKETEAQVRARAWLKDQNEIPSKRTAISASGKPAP